MLQKAGETSNYGTGEGKHPKTHFKKRGKLSALANFGERIFFKTALDQKPIIQHYDFEYSGTEKKGRAAPARILGRQES